MTLSAAPVRTATAPPRRSVKVLRGLMALGVALPLALGPAWAVGQEAPMATAPAPAVPVVAPVDAIGALIDRQGGAEIDEQTAETLPAAKPVVVAPGAAAPAPAAAATPLAPAPYTPVYARPTRSGLNRPVMLHETGLSPDGPPDASEITYESRVRGGIAAAQGLQGPLDGAWTLSGADGGKLFALQMVDPGQGRGGLEGAWRDLKRGAAIGAVGVIDEVQRSEDGLTLRFAPRGVAEPLLVKLTPTSGGGWRGDMTDRSGSAPVVLVRDGPAPIASYAVLGAGGAAFAPRPYDSTVRAAPARKPAAKASKAKARKKKATAKKSAAKKTVKLRKTKG